ncbi:MAG TPA: DUF1854 domain-containing protein [Abditibacteriaceae bacterium]|jgi:hypothetical protein
MEFIYLDPKTTRLETAPDGTLRAHAAHGCAMEVDALRTFPLSHPRAYISLRDGKGKELGIIETIDALDSSSRELLDESLRRRYFLPKITAILEASERFGSSQWEVETDRGPRTLSTGVINEAVTEVEPGRYLITDVEGNRFEIPDLMQLDEASRARFLGKA